MQSSSCPEDSIGQRTLEEESRLALLIKQGDEEAFVQLYEQYFKLVYGYFYLQTGSVPATEDLTSKTFIQALNRLREGVTLTQRWSFWLFAIARDLSQAWLQETQPLSLPGFSADELERAEGNSFEEILARKRIGVVWDLVRQLPSDCQQVLTLRYRDNLSYIEIALCLKLTVNASKKLHGRAMRRLRDLICRSDLGEILGKARELAEMELV